MVPLYKVPRAVKSIEVGPRMVDAKEATGRYYIVVQNFNW